MSTPTSIDERIALMSDDQLENLQANAERLKQSGAPAQRIEAERILPLIAAAREEQRVAKAAAQQEKRRVTTRTAATTRAAAKSRKAAAEVEEAADE